MVLAEIKTDPSWDMQFPPAVMADLGVRMTADIIIHVLGLAVTIAAPSAMVLLMVHIIMKIGTHWPNTITEDV